jgi:hypothetical protein
LFTCAIQSITSAVICWGYDEQGATDPPAVVDGTAGSASAIAAGDQFGCAIHAGTAAVVCWGAIASPPAAVDGSAGTAISIAAGGAHVCAIQAGTRAVVCWGADSRGQSSPPDSLDGVRGGAVAIASGFTHSLAIKVPELESLYSSLTALATLVTFVVCRRPLKESVEGIVAD